MSEPFGASDEMKDLIRELSDPTYNDFYSRIDDVFEEIHESIEWARLFPIVEDRLRKISDKLQDLDEYMYERLGMGE